MNAPAVVALLLCASAQLAIAQDDDALRSLALPADMSRLLLKASGPDAFPTGRARVHDDKAHRRAMALLTLRPLYADYFATQGLPLAQSDDVIRALAEEHTLASSGWLNGVQHAPTQEDQRAAMAVRARLAEMLGREKFAALTEYEDTLPERMQLQQLSDWLRRLDRPLTIEQKEGLVAILRSERHRLSGSLLNAPKDSRERAAEIVALRDSFDRHVRALFDAVLTPAQRGIADAQFADRSGRLHDALESYDRAFAEGDEQPFTYPAD